MVRTSQSANQGVRVLGPGDVAEALELIAADPVVNVFADYRTRITQLDPRWLGGEMWGYYEGDKLVSMCHVGANLVPVNATPGRVRRLRRAGATSGPRSSTIVGPQESVELLWAGLEEHWPPPRDLRWDQPHLVATQRRRRCGTTPWCGVRRRRRGTSSTRPAWRCTPRRSGSRPELDGGRDLYRARVEQLIGRGWSFSRIEDGRVLFKAEVACATPNACQIQGVYVDPELRGQGLAAAGMAAVVDICLREIAPAVSLYVNAHNLPARAAYAQGRLRADRHLRHDHVLSRRSARPRH